jgi:hypothetical protein
METAMFKVSAPPAEGQVERDRLLAAAQSWSLADLFMGHARPLEKQDIPRVAQLYTRVYGDKYATRQEQLLRDLTDLFLGHPWYDERYPSLVYQDSKGDIVGCIGVLPRPMQFKGRQVTAAITHSFMVEPGSRASMAALHLARRFFTGRQDISMADGNNSSRVIWEVCGGSASLLYSLCWTRPLRPCRYLLSFLANHGLPGSLASLMRPGARLADLIVARASPAFRFPAPEAEAEELPDEALAALLPELTRRLSLTPSYDPRSSAWLVDRLRRNTRYGTLQKVLVRAPNRRILGWYLYFLKPTGVAEVVHIATEKAGANPVLEHLFRHAWEQGAISISGQFDPALFGALSEKGCMFHHKSGANSWMMLHSKQPELIQAILAGDVFLSRLEGEWWISSILG